MTGFQQTLSVVAGIVFAAAFVPYIYAILRKGAKPIKSTWIIWATLDAITFAGMAVQGVFTGQMTAAVVAAWVVVVLAFKYGVPGWSLVDKLCLVGAALGIVLWAVFSSPLLGMITSLGVVFLGSLPTLISAFHHPERENRLAWTIYWSSCLLQIPAIPEWVPEQYLQPIAFLAVETTMVVLLWRPRKVAATNLSPG